MQTSKDTSGGFALARSSLVIQEMVDEEDGK